MGIQYPVTPHLIMKGPEQESTFCAHTLQHRGGNIVKNLDYQNLCLTKTCCNCSARLCPLKILFLGFQTPFRNDETTRPLSAYA